MVIDRYDKYIVNFKSSWFINNFQFIKKVKTINF